jgi:hypothetical protein
MTAPAWPAPAGGLEPGWSRDEPNPAGSCYQRHVPRKGVLRVAARDARRGYAWYLSTSRIEALTRPREGFAGPGGAMRDADRQVALLSCRAPGFPRRRLAGDDRKPEPGFLAVDAAGPPGMGPARSAAPAPRQHGQRRADGDAAMTRGRLAGCPRRFRQHLQRGQRRCPARGLRKVPAAGQATRPAGQAATP